MPFFQDLLRNSLSNLGGQATQGASNYLNNAVNSSLPSSLQGSTFGNVGEGIGSMAGNYLSNLLPTGLGQFIGNRFGNSVQGILNRNVPSQYQNTPLSGIGGMAVNGAGNYFSNLFNNRFGQG